MILPNQVSVITVVLGDIIITTTLATLLLSFAHIVKPAQASKQTQQTDRESKEKMMMILVPCTYHLTDQKAIKNGWKIHQAKTRGAVMI